MYAIIYKATSFILSYYKRHPETVKKYLVFFLIFDFISYFIKFKFTLFLIVRRLNILYNGNDQIIHLQLEVTDIK